MLDEVTLEDTELDTGALEDTELEDNKLEDIELDNTLLLTAWLDTELTVDDELDLLPSPPHATSVNASVVSVASWGNCWRIFIRTPVTKE